MKTLDAVHSSSWWSIRYPSHWDAQQDAECMTFTDSDYSALQISAARKTGGDITDEELLSDAQQFAPPGAEIISVAFPHFTGMRADYVADGIVWRVWFLRSGRTLLLVTYNADPPQHDLEIDVIEMIVASLTPNED